MEMPKAVSLQEFFAADIREFALPYLPNLKKVKWEGAACEMNPQEPYLNNSDCFPVITMIIHCQGISDGTKEIHLELKTLWSILNNILKIKLFVSREEMLLHIYEFQLDTLTDVTILYLRTFFFVLISHYIN